MMNPQLLEKKNDSKEEEIYKDKDAKQEESDDRSQNLNLSTSTRENEVISQEIDDELNSKRENEDVSQSRDGENKRAVPQNQTQYHKRIHQNSAKENIMNPQIPEKNESPTLTMTMTTRAMNE